VGRESKHIGRISKGARRAVTMLGVMQQLQCIAVSGYYWGNALQNGLANHHESCIN
jgi:hypothetical protein